MDLAGFCDKNIIVSDEALHCGGGRGVKPFFVRAKPCLPLWSFSLIRKTELLVAFNITSGIEASFFSAKSRTLLIYRYQKKEDTLVNLLLQRLLILWRMRPVEKHQQKISLLHLHVITLLLL